MRRRIAPLLLTCLLPLAACEYEVISSRSSWDVLGDNPQLRVEGGNGPGAHAGGLAVTGNAQPQAWAVLVAAYEGEYRYANAEAAVQRIAGQADVPELWIADLGGVARVYSGRFRDAGDNAARDRLAAVRAVTLGGDTPFAAASLEPLAPGGTTQTAAADPWDLSQYLGKYTLQIGYYDDAYDGQGGREVAAEQAVERMRDKGEAAFYYHGPHRSLVCVGLFDPVEAFEEQADAVTGVDATVRTYSRAVRDVREQHLHHFVNGRYVERSFDGEDLGRQPTQLIGPVGGVEGG